jgi:Orn/Lys/Arg decarboxylase, C-terminal domain/Orn/Lys/Arg decarboxylase, major domain
VVTTSGHKTLPALSQFAVMLAQGDLVAMGRLTGAVRMTQSTSPLMPVYLSGCGAQRVMALRGMELLNAALELAADVRRRLARIPGLRVLAPDDLPRPELADPLKVVVDVHRLGTTGFAVDLLLRTRYRVAAEGADLANVYLVLTTADDADSADHLLSAFAALTADGTVRCRVPGHELLADVKDLLHPRPQGCSPRAAYFGSQVAVPFAAAVGRLVAEPVTPYPPGIPVLLPGEEVDAATVEWLRDAVAAGAHVHGAADPHLGTLRWWPTPPPMFGPPDCSLARGLRRCPRIEALPAPCHARRPQLAGRSAGHAGRGRDPASPVRPARTRARVAARAAGGPAAISPAISSAAANPPMSPPRQKLLPSAVRAMQRTSARSASAAASPTVKSRSIVLP